EPARRLAWRPGARPAIEPRRLRGTGDGACRLPPLGWRGLSGTELPFQRRPTRPLRTGADPAHRRIASRLARRPVGDLLARPAESVFATAPRQWGEGEAMSPAKRRIALRWYVLLGLVVLAGVASAGVWWYRRAPVVLPPAVDLSGVDQETAALIQS